ncbi:amidohydrolase [Hydrogenophaga palleronii]|uniref:amidohydrolase n=1 Tax=Hydrogenophaga palleronii TaxID=65655 RepID=UPI000A9CF585|nr:amidohydrolase [Hydrogenophaga palleronii]
MLPSLLAAVRHSTTHERLGAIALLGLSAMVVLASCGGGGHGAPAADVVLRNGYVYTVDGQDRVAQAVAVRDGHIVYVGSNEGAAVHLGHKTRIVDLEGRMVMPGMIDGHVHPLSGAASTLKCSLEFQPLTIAQMQARLQACLSASTNASADTWLEVVNWDRQAMNTADRDPTRLDLDALNTPRPIMVSSIDHHSLLVNTRALQIAQITATTPDPAGGRIGHDANGEPNGLLEDGASLLVESRLPPLTDEERLKHARIALDLFRRNGVTGFMAALSDENEVKAFSTLSRSGELTARAEFAMLIDPGAAAADPAGAVAGVKAVAQRYGQPANSATPVVEVRHVKFPADGVLQAPAQTARLLEPYNVNTGTPQAPVWTPGTQYGEVYYSQPVLNAVTLEAAKAGFDTHLHAIGDATVRMGLNAAENARAQGAPADWRPSIAHVELVDPQDYGRFKAANVVANMQFQWAQRAPYSVDAVQQQLGPTRFERMEPEGSLMGAGARIAYGSDWPVDPMGYFYNLRVGVTRSSDPNHPASFGPAYAGRLNSDPLLSRADVLRAITANSAYQLRLDAKAGSIEQGKWADLIVLDRNFMTAPETEMAFTGVLLTMVGGKVVWATAPFATAFPEAPASAPAR